MANLIKVAQEENPYNNAGVILFAYFDGTPTDDELRAVIEAEISEDMKEWAAPELHQNEISKRAGLERWLIGDVG